MATVIYMLCTAQNSIHLKRNSHERKQQHEPQRTPRQHEHPRQSRRVLRKVFRGLTIQRKPEHGHEHRRERAQPKPRTHLPSHRRPALGHAPAPPRTRTLVGVRVSELQKQPRDPEDCHKYSDARRGRDCERHLPVGRGG
ncbi:hypothetical protein C8Q80DRAFT_609844 [Daedaleopsis nitida]|nr:hypothetical protein C8Q80DRAFT_609844 [Daedaleopsis nitida]